MKLTSPAFKDGGIIPSLYTCEGKNINPPLLFSEIPDLTQSLCLILDDPDVPKTLMKSGVYDHWVVFNMPKETLAIKENATPPGIQGKNTAGQNGYIGPCPPDRQHRYFFKLYALDISLNLPSSSTKAQVKAAMQGHILEECVLIGLYEKGKGY